MPIKGAYGPRLLVVDAYSKWSKIYSMETTTAEQIFATHRLPRQNVYDNGPQFIVLFQKFCETQGIHHIKKVPYSPRSNGEVERLLQTFKKDIEKRDPHTNDKIQEAIIDFLAMCRSMPQSKTI